VSTTAATMSAAAEAAPTTVEAATTATPASKCMSTAASKCMSTAACDRVSASIASPAASVSSTAPSKAVTGTSVANSTPIANPTAIAYPATVAVAIATTTVVAAATPVAVVPRAGADKDATDEPARTIVAIGRTCVRGVVVIPPRADRSRVSVSIITVPRANAYPDTDLGISRSSKERCGNQDGAEQHEISKKAHFGPPRQGICSA
jgi:hypothetical protein